MSNTLERNNLSTRSLPRDRVLKVLDIKAGEQHFEIRRPIYVVGVDVLQAELAWLLARSQVIVAIPGTLSSTHLEENIGAQDLDLSADDLAQLDSYRLSTFDARSLARRFVPPRLRRVAVSMLRVSHSLRPRR
jgi:aryl-alcohol dehydrogenase-like predicted oxidoreductase